MNVLSAVLLFVYGSINSLLFSCAVLLIFVKKNATISFTFILIHRGRLHCIFSLSCHAKSKPKTPSVPLSFSLSSIGCDLVWWDVALQYCPS